MQDKPQLFSTALMWLLAELFETLPEAGDLDKPKLVFFFDEAHLLFAGATDAFVQSVDQTVRLIRSKGVGVFFGTQTPKDVPVGVLAQLGNRVQHALRAFTPDDAKALKATVSTFPKSDLYDLEELLPALGHRRGGGDDPGRQRRPHAGRAHPLRAPASRMAPADDVDAAAAASPLFAKYGTRVDASPPASCSPRAWTFCAAAVRRGLFAPPPRWWPRPTESRDQGSTRRPRELLRRRPAAP